MLERDATDDEDLGPEARLHINRADLLAAIKDNEAAIYIQRIVELEVETHHAFCTALVAAQGSELGPRLQNLKMEINRLVDAVVLRKTLLVIGSRRQHYLCG